MGYAENASELLASLLSGNQQPVFINVPMDYTFIPP